MDSLFSGKTYYGNKRIYSKKISTKEIMRTAFEDMILENIHFDNRLIRASPKKNLFPKELIYTLDNIREIAVHEKGFYDTYFSKYEKKKLDTF